MSTLRVTAEQLTILEHPNADALELAQVGLYRAVVAKGAYRTGDWAVYIPEQAVLPEELIEELGLAGKLAGSAHNRVKAVRLRGEVSQGIVCLPAALAGVDLARAHVRGDDFAAELGVTKWVPPIPVHLAGEVESCADLLPWVDIENVKRFPAVFAPGEYVVATEKIHGTCLMATYLTDEDEVKVSSKGLGAQKLVLKEAQENLYWRVVRGHGVDQALRQITARYAAQRVAIFGEAYGAGVQDLHYGANATGGLPGFAVFDIAVDVAGQVRWLGQDEMLVALALLTSPLASVPRLYEGPYDEQRLLKLAEGREQVSGSEVGIREGIVVRPFVERSSDVLGGRAIVKFVSDAYLLRKGGTEFE